MKISHIRIENILGITSLEVTPGGTLTEISGDNGQGKTSILEAIKAGVKGGHDATLLRHGAEKGEIVLVMDDGVELHKKVTATGSTLDLVKDGKKVAKASDTIKGLTDLLSVNPVDFLTASKKDRVKVLLEVMPVQVDIKRLSDIAGFPVNAQAGIDGLALLDVVRTEIFNDRTMTNRAIKEKDATINQLRQAMPDAPGGVEGDEDSLRAQLQELQTKRDAETARIDQKLVILKTTYAESVAAAKLQAQEKIAEINAELQNTLASMSSAQNETEAKAARARQRAIDTFNEGASPLQAGISAISQNRDAAAKRAVTIETLAKMDKDAEDLAADAKRQTASLEQIDAYKSELLNSLPVPGLEMRDGELYRYGVAFDRLNTAQQVEIAIEVAKLRAGDLSICCVDRFECLSPETLEEFKAKAEDSGLQLFVTRVDSGELTIKTQ